MNRQGFTFVELLIVVGVLAFLSAFLVLILNPLQIIAQSRDGRRVADIQVLSRAVQIAKAFGGVTDGTAASTVYISLPDTNADGLCNEYTLPGLAGGWSYKCLASSANLRNVDGTGWVPIDFSPVSNRPINVLPIGPVNSSTYFYSYTKTGLSTVLESDKYIAQTASNDGGTQNNYYETAPIVWIGGASTVVILTLAGSQNWTVPVDWNNSSNSIEVIGAGGNGGAGTIWNGGGGGGGGEYRKAVNVNLSGSVPYFIATGGSGSDTTFNTNTVISKAGGNGQSPSGFVAPGAAGGTGGTGAAANFDGGNGAGNNQGGGAGGGGSGGRIGIGKAGASAGGDGGGGGGGSNGGTSSAGNTGSGATAGDGGNGTDGTGKGIHGSPGGAATASKGAGGGGANSGGGGSNGGAGSIDTTFDATHGAGGGGGGAGCFQVSGKVGGNGGTYGGGGGAGCITLSGTNAGGTGGQGIIIITYNP